MKESYAVVSYPFWKEIDEYLEDKFVKRMHRIWGYDCFIFFYSIDAAFFDEVIVPGVTRITHKHGYKESYHKKKIKKSDHTRYKCVHWYYTPKYYER